MITLLSHIHSLRWTVPTMIMLGASPISMLFWFVWRTISLPLHANLYLEGEEAITSFHIRLLLFFFNSYVKPKVYGYGDIDSLLEKEENVIYLSNHQCTVDWAIACMLSEVREGIGKVRFIMKSGLKYFPHYGFSCYQHSCIYVDRGGKFDGQKYIKQLQYLKNNNLRTWLIIFPEGTRFNPELQEVINKSKNYATSLGYNELEHVLTPRIGALKSSLIQLENHMTAVYDVTLAYSNTFNTETQKRSSAFGMPDFLMGSSAEVHVNVERIPIEDVPTEEKLLQNWMYKQFQKKDRLLSEFYNPESEMFGKFPGEPTMLRLMKRRTIPPFIFYTAALAFILSQSKLRALYWKGGLCIIIGGIVWMTVKS